MWTLGRPREKSGLLASAASLIPARPPPQAAIHTMFEPAGFDVCLTVGLVLFAFGVALRAVTKLHGAFKVQFLCAQRRAGVSLNVLSKFWRNSGISRPSGWLPHRLPCRTSASR